MSGPESLLYLKVPRCAISRSSLLLRIIYDTLWNWNLLAHGELLLLLLLSFYVFQFYHHRNLLFLLFFVFVLFRFAMEKSLNNIMALSISHFPFESRLGFAIYTVVIFVLFIYSFFCVWVCYFKNRSDNKTHYLILDTFENVFCVQQHIYWFNATLFIAFQMNRLVVFIFIFALCWFSINDSLLSFTLFSVH